MGESSQLHVRMEKLVQSLQLLAGTFELQVSSLPKFVHVPDEVALTYDEVYVFVDELASARLLGVAERGDLQRLDAVLADMSQNKSLWTMHALRTAHQWEDVRRLASDVLRSLGREKERPDLFWVQYVRGKRASTPGK